MIDIEVLRVIWWVLLGVLFIGFAVTDGFDLGAAALFPLIARNETERVIVLNCIRPIWEGNQVWIILGAGAIFAAWPFVYAAAFSVAYFPVLLLLLTMGISRPVSFKYRTKLPSLFWRRTWDWIVFIGGFFPALIFGVLMGNILQGLPFSFDSTLRIAYEGSLIDLFSPFALWCGITSVFLLAMHGGLYIAVKTEGLLHGRAIRYAQWSAILLIIFFALAGVWTAKGLVGFQVVSGANPLGESNPLAKEVMAAPGLWMQNYHTYPLLMLAPALGFLGAIGALLLARWRDGFLAFICSGMSIIGVIGTVGVSMFPFILPSSVHLPSSLLVWDASSTQLTLLLMLVATLIFLPIILLYTAWVYKVMSGKVTAKTVAEEEKHAY